MKPEVRGRGRRIRAGELPIIYLGMRQYSPASKKMEHVKGHTFVVRNYTPGNAKRVIDEAFTRDIALQKARLEATIGQFVSR